MLLRRLLLPPLGLASLVVTASVAPVAACGGRTMLATGVRNDSSPVVASTDGDGGHTAGEGGAPAGGSGGAPANVDAAPPPNSVVTCGQYQNTTVGSYIVETDYWNLGSCPGTQCMTVNDTTGAFTVTQGPSCGNTVASYPNVLYGSSFGAVSPGSVLPMQLSALTSVTSSWSFSVGGVSTDQYDVAYDIWFCPNDACGAAGFNGGTEADDLAELPEHHRAGKRTLGQ